MREEAGLQPANPLQREWLLDPFDSILLAQSISHRKIILRNALVTNHVSSFFTSGFV